MPENEITNGVITLKPHYKRFLFEQHEFRSAYQNAVHFFKLRPREFFLSKLKSCVSCPARQEATQVVLPEGDPLKEIIMVGRNPGLQEDKYGQPFYPKAPGGRWLHKYLEALSTERKDVYISNALFCHTNKDRPPISTELSMCAIWKMFEFSYLKNMRYVFLLGNDSIRQFMGLDFPSVVRIFGDVYQMHFESKKIMVFPCYHPAFTLRNPQTAIDVFTYLKSARALIDADKRSELKWLI